MTNFVIGGFAVLMLLVFFLADKRRDQQEEDNFKSSGHRVDNDYALTTEDLVDRARAVVRCLGEPLQYGARMYSDNVMRIEDNGQIIRWLDRIVLNAKTQKYVPRTFVYDHSWIDHLLALYESCRDLERFYEQLDRDGEEIKTAVREIAGSKLFQDGACSDDEIYIYEQFPGDKRQDAYVVVVDNREVFRCFVEPHPAEASDVLVCVDPEKWKGRLMDVVAKAKLSQFEPVKTGPNPMEEALLAAEQKAEERLEALQKQQPADMEVSVS